MWGSVGVFFFVLFGDLTLPKAVSSFFFFFFKHIKSKLSKTEKMKCALLLALLAVAACGVAVQGRPLGLANGEQELTLAPLYVAADQESLVPGEYIVTMRPQVRVHV